MKSRLKILSIIATCIFVLVLQPAYSLSEASAILTNPEVGAKTSITFSFKIDDGVALTSNSMFIFQLPSAFDVTEVKTSDAVPVLGIDGGFSQVVQLGNNELGVIRDGTGSDVVDKDCRITIRNVINPTELGLTDTFLIRVYSPNGGGGWAVGGPANPNIPTTPQWVTNQSVMTGSTTAPGVVISESLLLGGKSNHSKFCLFDANKFNLLGAFFGFIMVLLCCGIKNNQRASS